MVYLFPTSLIPGRAPQATDQIVTYRGAGKKPGLVNLSDLNFGSSFPTEINASNITGLTAFIQNTQIQAANITGLTAFIQNTQIQAANITGLTAFIDSNGQNWLVASNNFTANPRGKYLIVDSSSRLSVTFPSNPSIGDSLEFINVSGNNGFRTNELNKYNGFNTRVDYKLKQKITFVYSDNDRGWVSDKRNDEALMIDVLWTPTNLGINGILWLDSSDTNTLFSDTNGNNKITATNQTVLRANNKFGNNNFNLISPTGNGPLWVTNVLNSLPCLRFDGMNTRVLQWRQVYPNSVNSFCIYIVQKTTGDILLITHNSENMQIRIGDADNNRLSAHPAGHGTNNVNPRTSFIIAEYIKTGGLMSFFESGNARGSVATLVSVFNFNRIGPAFFGGQPVGDYAEVIISSDTSDLTRQRIEGYLAWKWGLASQLPSNHPFLNNPPFIVSQ